MSDSSFTIQVVGGGSWGLALARLAAMQGQRVRIWSRAEDDPDYLREHRRSRFFMPEVLELPESVAVGEIDPAADIAVFAVPSHAMRAAALQHRFSPRTVRVSVAKGIENETLCRMSQVLTDVGVGGPVVALSGPTHAEEVAQDLPASLVAASADTDAAEQVQAAFMAPNVRVYTAADVVGVELGGSVKNVIAIAAGVCDGYGLGDNARAALMTRGLAEMVRLGVACGADPQTFAGLSGMGDLIVTCGSHHSRNRRLGEELAHGKTLEEIQAGSHMVAEGVKTSRSLHALSAKMGVEMPISEAVYCVLFEGLSPQEAAMGLLARAPKPERA